MGLSMSATSGLDDLVVTVLAGLIRLVEVDGGLRGVEDVLRPLVGLLLDDLDVQVATWPVEGVALSGSHQFSSSIAVTTQTDVLSSPSPKMYSTSSSQLRPIIARRPVIYQRSLSALTAA